MTRGWQFTFSDSAQDGRRGLRGSADLSPRLVEGDAVVSQALMMMLGTTPGERVMRPDWGCPLHRLLFQPNDGATAGLAIHYVRQAIDRHEPRAEVLSIDAGADPSEPGQLNLTLTYRVRASGAQAELRFALDLHGAEA
jgi:phage baseplate assembly protein W